MAVKEFNVDLDIKGKVSATNVPNSTGSIVTWNTTSKVFGFRTNAQIISDLNLSSSFVPYTGATANVDLGSRSITSTGGFIGNASTATTLATARTINGTPFNGSDNITTANWGTARNITIGDTTKSVNGSGNVAWSLSEIGASSVNHTHPISDIAGLQTELNKIGNLPSLTTTNKTSLVGAVNEVNNIQIGGRNLLLNSKEEWRLFVGGGYGIVVLGQTDAKVGETFTASVFVRNSTSPNGISLEVHEMDATGQRLKSYSSHVVNDKVELTTTIQHPDIKYVSINLCFNGYYSQFYQYEYSKEKLEKGNKATDWTPAPEDQVSDWAETNSDSLSFIKGKEIVSNEFNNIYDQINARANNRLSNLASDLTPREKGTIRDKIGVVLPTVNDGKLTLTTGTGLNGSTNFTANQSSNSIFDVSVASTHKLPTTAEWNTALANTTYTAGNGLTLSGTAFSLPITVSGSGNYVSDVTQTTNGITVTKSTLPDLTGFVSKNGDNVTPNSKWDNYSKGIYGSLDSDFWRIQGNLVSPNNIELELATADDATEAIVARQYSGEFASKVREAYLLDSAGNTSFPGIVRVSHLNLTGTTRTPVGQVSTESSIHTMAGDYGYGISMNQGGGLDIMANQSGQPIRLWSGQTNSAPYKSMELNGSGVTVYGSIFTTNYGNSDHWFQAYNWGNHKAVDSHQYLGATYVGGGIRTPADFGAGKLKLEMVNGGPLGNSQGWNDVLWLSSYTGSDVKGSNAIIMSKMDDEIGFSRQNYDSGTWGTYRKIWHSGNLNPDSYLPLTGGILNNNNPNSNILTTKGNIVVEGPEYAYNWSFANKINTYEIVSGNEYKWYNTYWKIGNRRGESDNTIGFSFMLNDIEHLRIQPDGYLLNSKGLITEGFNLKIGQTGDNHIQFTEGNTHHYGYTIFHGETACDSVLVAGGLVSNSTITSATSITAQAFYESSLRKYKTNIKPYEESALEVIKNIEIVTFDRTDSDIKNKIGVIADDSPSEILNEELDAVDLYKTVFVLTKAVQELQEEIKQLKQQVEAE